MAAAATTTPETVLFEAVSTPPRSLDGKGLRLVALVLCLGAAAVSALFLWLGAWPVLGFAGAEIGLALLLLNLHRRRSARQREVVQLTTEGRLTVTRTDGSGRHARTALEAYWTRVRLQERAGGAAGALWLTERGRPRVEIGRFLAEEERRDLADALAEALRRYREPRFDNPQLREGA